MGVDKFNALYEKSVLEKREKWLNTKNDLVDG